jgi:hypothetical protein
VPYTTQPLPIEQNGTPVPPNAQAAVQEGKLVAKNILAAIDGREMRPFDYKPVGQLVEIGSDFAVNQVMNVKFSGLIASLFWRATYLYKLESPQSRARIAATGSSTSSSPRPSPRSGTAPRTLVSNLRLTVSCPDRKGLISALSSFISMHDGNILSADQYVSDGGTFFMRWR